MCLENICIRPAACHLERQHILARSSGTFYKCTSNLNNFKLLVVSYNHHDLVLLWCNHCHSRPHTAAPDKPITGNVLMNRLTAPIDKMRDAVRFHGQVAAPAGTE